MSEYVPTYLANPIQRAVIGDRGLFVERAGNVISVCTKTGCGIEVILVLNLEEAEALGSFLSVASVARVAGPVD